MNEHTLTIKVRVPHGYEPTGEYRFPEPGEPFLTTTGSACVAHNNDQCARRMNRVILKKVWQPPVWMPDGRWLYQNNWGEWFISVGEPEYRGCYFGGVHAEGAVFARSFAAVLGHEFDPPPADVKKIQVKHPEIEPFPDWL